MKSDPLEFFAVSRQELDLHSAIAWDFPIAVRCFTRKAIGFIMSASIVLLFVLFTIRLADGTIIYTAQCRSRCHSIFGSSKGKDQTSSSQCLSPCDKDASKLGNCRDYCKKTWGLNNAPCHYSCKYYTKLILNDYGKGSCSTKKPTHNYEYCDRNKRCKELNKCCSVTNSCEKVVVYGEEVKVVVSHITSSSILARWKPSNITNAVYIIQLRELDSRSIHYTDSDWFPWEQIKQDVEITGVKITGLASGVRLQLRVAVANSSGLQSIGPPTPVIRTLFNASNPSSPDQIWVTKKSYRKKLVNVSLAWSPPVVLDVPVHRYRIYWKEIPLATADLAVVTKKRTWARGDRYNYTIQNLKADTTYYIEIEAICLWKKKRLKSPKLGLNVSTGHIKDNGKGSIDVYFKKIKTKKDEEDNHPPRFYDESIQKLDVLIERQKTSARPSTKDANTKSYNSAKHRQQNSWLTLTLLTFCLFAFKTN